MSVFGHLLPENIRNGHETSQENDQGDWTVRIFHVVHDERSETFVKPRFTFTLQKTKESLLNFGKKVDS